MSAQETFGMAEARSVRIEDEIARRGIRLQGRGSERVGPCPDCGGHDRKQLWNCRGCGYGGDVIALVRHLDGLSFGEAVRLLTGHAPPQKPLGGQSEARSAEHKEAAGGLPSDDEPKCKAASWLWSTEADDGDGRK